MLTIEAFTMQSDWKARARHDLSTVALKYKNHSTFGAACADKTAKKEDILAAVNKKDIVTALLQPWEGVATFGGDTKFATSVATSLGITLGAASSYAPSGKTGASTAPVALTVQFEDPDKIAQVLENYNNKQREKNANTAASGEPLATEKMSPSQAEEWIAMCALYAYAKELEGQGKPAASIAAGGTTVEVKTTDTTTKGGGGGSTAPASTVKTEKSTKRKKGSSRGGKKETSAKRRERRGRAANKKAADTTAAGSTTAGASTAGATTT